MVTLPKAIPVTTPVLLTVATVVFPLVHTPPVVASDNVVVIPAHMLVTVPVMGRTEGAARMLTGAVTAVTQPDALVT